MGVSYIHILDFKFVILDFCFSAVTTQMEPKVDFRKSLLNCRNSIVCSPEVLSFFRPVEACGLVFEQEF